MKHIFTLFLLLSALNLSSLHAQVDTKGTDFVVSFAMIHTASPESATLQIRIAATEAANGTITFNDITGSGRTVNFNIPANGVFTHNLTSAQKVAAYNNSTANTQGLKTNKAVFINSNVPVTAYAFSSYSAMADATNLLPIPTLGNDYYHLGYGASSGRDQYMVVATQNGTTVRENGTQVETLNAGQVYIRRAAANNIDLGGLRITTNHPVAYFSAHGYYTNRGGGDNIFQQLTPVNTWGKNFMVPVSIRDLELIRVIASENGTIVKQTGATLPFTSSGQTAVNAPSQITLNAGQMVEWRITRSNNGCYIQADKPIQVASYMVGNRYGNYDNAATNDGDEAFVNIPPIEQTVRSALIAPFVGGALSNHHILIVTPTATKNNTMISTGGGEAVPLSGGTWRDNAASGMSYYNTSIGNANTSYVIDNDAGLHVYGYGFGSAISYYYMAGSALRNLTAAFYVNDEHYQDIDGSSLCETATFNVRAELNFTKHSAAGSLKWFINNVEQTSARDQIQWVMPTLTHNTPYQIKMEVRSTTNDVFTETSTIRVANPMNPGSIGSDQQVATGGTPAALTNVTAASGGAGAITYRWQSSTNNSTWNNISGDRKSVV